MLNREQDSRPVLLDDYAPESIEEAQLWEGEETLPVPDRSEIGPKQIGAYTLLPYRGEQNLILINFIHRDYPGLYLQWQMNFIEDGERVFAIQMKEKDCPERMPQELIERIFYEKMRPMLVSSHPEFFE